MSGLIFGGLFVAVWLGIAVWESIFKPPRRW